METKDEMCKAHHKALLRIGSALDLDPGDDLHKKAVPAINATKAHNNLLRATTELAISWLESGDADMAHHVLASALTIAPEEVMASLEAEYDELARRQATPTMEMIIQAVHDEAGRCDSELTSPIFIRVDPHDYDALCDEEAAREATTEKRASSE